MDLELPDSFSPPINVLLEAFDLEPGSASYYQAEGDLGWPYLRYVFKGSEPGVIWISGGCSQWFLRPKDCYHLHFNRLTYSEALDLVFSHGR